MRKKKDTSSNKGDLQLRISRTDKHSALVVTRLEAVSEKSGLSINNIANLAVVAGLPMVESKMQEIHDPESKAA